MLVVTNCLCFEGSPDLDKKASSIPLHRQHTATLAVEVVPEKKNSITVSTIGDKDYRGRAS